MNCEGCAWHVRAHYKGTPSDEVYDECEYHNMVLHDDDRCEHYTKERDDE